MKPEKNLIFQTILFTCLLVLNTAFAVDFSKGKWIDLTYDFSEETIYWPTAKSFRMNTVFEGITEGGYFYSAYSYMADEHGGTHIDAPIHFYEGKHTVEQIPVERLVGNAIVINVAAKTMKNRDYQISVDDILLWEKNHGQIPVGSIVLINTGSGKLWPDKAKYMGTSKRGTEGVKELKFPGIHPKAAVFLATQRDIKAVGLDTPSIDFGKSTDYKSHQILFEKNIPGFENVANLDKLPPKGAIVFALPMKIKSGSGAPLRIVAFLSQSD